MSIKVATAVSGPYAHRQASVTRTMLLVMAGLTPATLYGFYTFGWPSIFLFLTTITSAIVCEAVCVWMQKKKVEPFIMDGSALLTGWLLAVSLPPIAPWWVGALGGFLAIVVGKQVFGGIGQNVFNPAMVGRVILLIAFPLEMTRFNMPMPLIGENAITFMEGLHLTFLGVVPAAWESIDAMASASILGHIKVELGRGIPMEDIAMHGQGVLDMGLGSIAGSMGETSALLLLAGGIFIIAMRITTWHIPLGMLGAIAVLATIMNLVDPTHYPPATIHLLGGATMLGAFFIATDPTTAPVSNAGRLVFGIGIGVLVYVIRTWAAYPEGMAFAVLLMNSCAPLIDRYMRPRIYGRDRKGAPIQYNKDKLGNS